MKSIILLKNLKPEIRTRLRKVLKVFTTLLILASCYVFLFTFTRIDISCPFFKITGLYCPGCGVTRMCIALLQLDFKTAFHSNMAISLLLPILVPFFLHFIIQYIKKGTLQTSIIQNIILWFCIIVLVVFGFLRNLPMFSFLAP